MKIDTATSHLYADQSARSSGTARNSTASFSAVLSATTAATPRSDAQASTQVDFSSMTRQQMREWSNAQIRSGNMSLDEGRPFMAMSMHIPVSGASGSALQAVNDDEALDFTQTVRAGIQSALSRNDDATRMVLESAMRTMQQYQGDTIGIDTRA